MHRPRFKDRPYILIALLLILASLPCAALTTEGDRLVGLWATEPSDDAYAHVRFERAGDRYRGTIIWLNQPLFSDAVGPEWAGRPKADLRHPDAEKKGRPIIGMELAWGFRYKGNGHWADGMIYDPESGKTYKCKITRVGDRLEVRGFIGVSLLGRTTIWRAVTDSENLASTGAVSGGPEASKGGAE